MLSVVHRNLWDACILRQQCGNREPNAKVGNRAHMESLASVDFRTVGGFNLEVFVSDKFHGACRIHKLSSPYRCFPVSMILLAKHWRTIILPTWNHFSMYYTGLRLVTPVPINPYPYSIPVVCVLRERNQNDSARAAANCKKAMMIVLD